MNEKLKESIEKAIFDSIIKHELFGFKNIFDDYMIREVLNSFPKGYRNEVEAVINELLGKGLLELDERQYLRVTKKCQDLVFLSDYYTIDKLENKILSHLREFNYYADNVWYRLTYQSFCEKELNAYEKYIFINAIDKMIDDSVFECDSESNLKLTKTGEEKIYCRTV